MTVPSSLDFYRESDGLYAGVTISVAPEDVAANAPAGCVAVAAVPLPHTRRWVAGEMQPYQPPAPDGDHTWDAQIGQWILSRAVVLQRIRERIAQTTDPVMRARLQAIDDEIATLRAELGS